MNQHNGSALKQEDDTSATQTLNSDLSSSMENPINNLIASFRVLPSAQQAFDTSSVVLNQNGAVFMEILAGLQTSIRGMESSVFRHSPRSVIDNHSLPPIPNSLLRTPLRDRKRVRQAQEQESQLLNTGLNVKPKLVLVPVVPMAFRGEVGAERVWWSKDDLQSTLHRYQQTERARLSDPSISMEVAEWRSSTITEAAAEGGAISHTISNNNQNVYLKINLGASTGLWGYICFAKRKRRYDGRCKNRERAAELASNKRMKLTQKTQMATLNINEDEDEDGYAMISTRYHLFSEVETNKSKNDVSGFRWIQELCMHLNHLELSLPELLHRLSAYMNIMQEPCRLCSSLLKRGLPPVGRAFLPTPSYACDYNARVDENQDIESSGNVMSKADDIKPVILDAEHTGQSTPLPALQNGENGYWVAFHKSCL